MKLSMALATAFMINSIYALDNSSYAPFENEYNIGFGASRATLYNGDWEEAQSTTRMIKLEMEQLFQNNLWLDGSMTMVTSSSSNQTGGIGSSNSGESGIAGEDYLTQNPSVLGMNVKLGYAFPFASMPVQLVPYGTLGYNSNWMMTTVVNNGGANLTKDYFYTGGVGARANMKINDTILIYLDQLGAYNWDQSGPLNGIQPQNFTALTTTLGAKFNLWDNFQLGTNIAYSLYTYVASAPMDSNGETIYQPQREFSAMVTLGLTY